MRSVLSRAVTSFSSSSAEKLLLFGTSVAILFGAAFVLISKIENVLVLENGVGFLENFGLIAALFSDAVLFFLIKKYLDSCRDISKHFGYNAHVKEASRQLTKDVQLETDRRFALPFFITLGLVALASNISIHIFGEVGYHWNGDVFDSLKHPYSFALNKVFSLYSWCCVLPLCSYVALVSTIQMSDAVSALKQDSGVEYDLLHPDGAGGFASIRLAITYFNLAVIVLYLQISLYTVTFGRINLPEAAAYVLATTALLLANFVVFRKTDHALEAKRLSTLSRMKDRTYGGDLVSLEILRYYLDTFSRKSLQRRLSVILLALKSLAIAIPPAIKVLHFLSS